MPNQYKPYPMVLNNVFIGMLGIRTDQKDYFNIPDATATEQAFVSYIGSIKSHKRNIYSNRLNDTTATTVKSIAKVNNVSRRRKKLVNSRGGKPISIPTELTSTPAASTTGGTAGKPSIRFTTIRFPGAASNAEISSWLNSKLASHKPTYFKTPAGAAYPIGSSATTPAAPSTP